MIVLTEDQVNELCIFIENRIEKNACDHSLKNAFEWAELNEINREDFIDVLEFHGGYCDCEVIFNLPEDCDLILEEETKALDSNNSFKIPISFESSEDKVYNKALFSDSEYSEYNYTNDNELLIPAPFGFKSKKRTRKSTHFFIGMESQLPSEIGFIREIEPINSKSFAKKIRDLKINGFTNFSEREADYYLSRIDRLDIDKPMASYFMEKNGIGGKKTELRIHKIIFRK